MAGTLAVDTLTISGQTGNAVRGIAKAWVNFDGTTGTIRSSYNVSSVTRNASAICTVTMTNAMPNANYVIVTACRTTNTTDQRVYASFGGSAQITPTTTQFQTVTFVNHIGGDITHICAAVYS